MQAEGPRHRYLAMHSAGSGTTNSIAWTAHGLATLHDRDNQKVFDTVLVVTDRPVLDDQLQKAIKQVEGVEGTVAVLSTDEVRNTGAGSKSGLLAQQLQHGAPLPVAPPSTRCDARVQGSQLPTVAVGIVHETGCSARESAGIGI